MPTPSHTDGSRRSRGLPADDGTARASRAVLSVWTDCDPALRLPRVLARDGDALLGPMTDWQRDERLYSGLQPRHGHHLRQRWRGQH